MDGLPEKIGRYEVVGHLATGGMAEVLLARLVGPSGFERPVVVKRILPHLARTQQFTDMFLDEARIVARIRHPNVVGVHELGQQDGELFLVLEYLEGESASGLARRLASRAEPLDYRLAAHIVAEACAGLHAAHELTDVDGLKQGLVHRDMTPQNLFITYDGAVKVLDFGIAKVTDRVARTEAGQVKGKFEYMSPEQCHGKPLDRRSDIFALGVVLYELSTLHRLFKRATQLVTMKAICDEGIIPPSSLRADYPKVLEAICTKALEKRPEDRFQSAAEMRRALIAAMRTLEDADAAPPEEALAKLMRGIFADRVDAKSELLRRVSSGSAVTEFPAAETDGSVEIPVALDDMTEAAASIVGPPRSTRERPSRGWVALAAFAIVFTGVAVFVAMRTRTSTPTTATPTTSSAPIATTPPSVAPATSIAVQIESIPDGAMVVVDGRVLGPTPYTMSLQKSNDAVAIEVRKDGFASQRETIVPNVEQRVRLTLPPAPHATQHNVSTASHPTTTPPASATATGGFRRFD